MIRTEAAAAVPSCIFEMIIAMHTINWLKSCILKKKLLRPEGIACSARTVNLNVKFSIIITKTPSKSDFRGVLCRVKRLTKKHDGANMNNCTNIALLPVSGPFPWEKAPDTGTNESIVLRFGEKSKRKLSKSLRGIFGGLSGRIESLFEG